MFSIYTAADLAVGMQVVNVTSMVSRQPIVQLFACTCNSFLSHKSLGVDTTRRSKGDAPQPLNGLAPTLQQPITPHAGISHGIDQSQSTLQMHGSAAYEQENLLIITDEGLTAFDLPTCALKAQAFRTRGATCMAWSSLRQAVAVAKPSGLRKPARCSPMLRL